MRNAIKLSTYDRSDGSVVIEVNDNGVGISPDVKERIFDPFFTTKPTGMGMGLSICRSIIDAHGGRLWATRRSPDGTAFHFTLPPAEGSLNG